MKSKSWHLNRRELLRGSGVALALPFLNGMSWAKGSAGAGLPKRMLVSYFAYGAYMPNGQTGIPTAGKPHHDWSWWPCSKPGPLTFNKSSAPFEPLKDYVSYLRGLDHEGGWSLGGHSSGDVFATGADMTETETTNNISIDQVAANYHGHQTRHASLVLGTEGGTGSYGHCKTLSHRGPGRPIPSMQKPQEIFNRLFDPYAGRSIENVRLGLKREASILDLMLEDSRSLKGRLGHEDKGKIDEYLDSIRSLENRVERTSKWTHEPLAKVDTKGLNLEVVHKEAKEYTRCMYDLVYLAFQTDSTRFASLMLESESSSDSELWNYATYALGYKGATHDIAHKRPADFSGQWDLWRAEQHAYFLKRLRDTKEGDGNMLDRTIVLWGSGHPHASHSTKNYPIHLAGGNKLGLKHGNLHAFEGAKKVPLTNLYTTMLNAVDVPVEKFADSTGEMTEVKIPLWLGLRESVRRFVAEASPDSATNRRTGDQCYRTRSAVFLFFIWGIVCCTAAELPQALILGDSIYNEPSRSAAAMLQGRVQVVYPAIKPGNVHNSTTALENLDEWLGDKKWDLIHFNFGLGDLVYRAPGMKTFRVFPKHAGGVRATTPEQYEKNLRELVKRLKATGAKLVWASTTPIRHSASDIFEMKSEIPYNAIAAKVMKENGVAINDMYTYVHDLIDMNKPASHGADPFSFDKKPVHPPIVRSILSELDLIRPVKGPVKVFIMAGGWTHVGGGTVIDTKKPKADQAKGTLDDLALNEKTATDYPYLLAKDGTWATRPDVWIQFDRRGPKSGVLGIGYGGDRKRGIGPELALGHVLGNHFDQQVCIIKTVLGEPSLTTDLLPPSSGKAGASYTKLVQQVKDSLGRLQNKFPDYTDDATYQIAGLILSLDEKDARADLYAKNLPLLIADLRKEWQVPELPVIIVGSGIGGQAKPDFPEILKAQQAVAKRPQFNQSVSYVETRAFWPAADARASYRHATHEQWYNNAKSFLDIGDAIGQAMVKLKP